MKQGIYTPVSSNNFGNKFCSASFKNCFPVGITFTPSQEWTWIGLSRKVSLWWNLNISLLGLWFKLALLLKLTNHSFVNVIPATVRAVPSGQKTLLVWILQCILFCVFVSGKLVLTACEKKGFGGAMMFTFKCCGCWTTEIDYRSSELAQNSRRQIVSLALSLAFFISGHGYASYRKTLGRGLGLGVTSEKPFWRLLT